MRATSRRRAPQRNWQQRVEGDKAAAPGACPHCWRIIEIGPSGRRRHHRTLDGGRCTGGGILVRPVIAHLVGELPPIVLPPRRDDDRTLNGRALCDGCDRMLPLNSDGTIRRHRIRHQDPWAPYCTGRAA